MADTVFCEGGDLNTFFDREVQRYRPQLEDRPIRLGLYFPLLRGWRERGFTSKRRD